MKARELARNLRLLANLLDSLPNIDVSAMREYLETSKTEIAGSSVDQLAVNIYTLAQLANFKKSQWQEFIDAYELKVDLTKRDSNRDIVGKIMKYLAENPEAQNRMKKRIKLSDKRSPLTDAFDFLLGDKVGISQK